MKTPSTCDKCLHSKEYDEQDFPLLCKKTGIGVYATDSCEDFTPKLIGGEHKMREIKFRFWDTKENRWMIDGRDETNIYDFAFRSDMNWNFLTKAEAIERVIVEQYTGLKDKNGKEIYEGDKLQDSIDNDIGAVYCKESTAGFYCLWGDGSDMSLNFGVATVKCKIIGNIHQDPELKENTK